jgi:hypothetical protein
MLHMLNIFDLHAMYETGVVPLNVNALITRHGLPFCDDRG